MEYDAIYALILGVSMVAVAILMNLPKL